MFSPSPKASGAEAGRRSISLESRGSHLLAVWRSFCARAGAQSANIVASTSLQVRKSVAICSELSASFSHFRIRASALRSPCMPLHHSKTGPTHIKPVCFAHSTRKSLRASPALYAWRSARSKTTAERMKVAMQRRDVRLTIFLIVFGITCAQVNPALSQGASKQDSLALAKAMQVEKFVKEAFQAIIESNINIGRATQAELDCMKRADIHFANDVYASGFARVLTEDEIK